MKAPTKDQELRRLRRENSRMRKMLIALRTAENLYHANPRQAIYIKYRAAADAVFKLSKELAEKE